MKGIPRDLIAHHPQANPKFGAYTLYGDYNLSIAAVLLCPSSLPGIHRCIPIYNGCYSSAFNHRRASLSHSLCRYHLTNVFTGTFMWIIDQLDTLDLFDPLGQLVSSALYLTQLPLLARSIGPTRLSSHFRDVSSRASIHR